MRTFLLGSVALVANLLFLDRSVEPLPQTITLTGRLTFADYERLIEQPFDVPAGTRRIEIALTATGAERRTVIDLGLRGPDGLRGWSGGRTNRVSVSRLSATPGYLPGPLPPGKWAVLLGVPNIREGSDETYTIAITMSADESASDRPVLRSGPGWFVGDLHAHSFHSDGRGRSQGGKAVPVPMHRVLDEASKNGLDFIAVSDHNTASHWLDIDRLQPYYDRVLLLHGREITTYRGHANTVGERTFAEFRLPSPTSSPAMLLRPIGDAGAFVSINHPTAPDDERCMGCGWNVTDEQMRGAVHGVEVVNGDATGGPLYGWPFWADLLNRGWRVTAVGGSDDHTPDDPADRNVGTPATVVWARELSEAALVEGLKSGRVYVRTRGGQGPSVDIEAVSGDVTYPMGADLPATPSAPVLVRAAVRDASGQTLEWILKGRVDVGVPITEASVAIERSVNLKSGDWVSVVIRDAAGPTAISNAIRRR